MEMDNYLFSLLKGNIKDDSKKDFKRYSHPFRP